MAIPDLLWACPECGTDRGLQPAGHNTFSCSACRTRFARARGSRIRATRPHGQTTTRDAPDWLDRLPPVSSLVDTVGAGPIRSARVAARAVTETDVVRGGEGYLNRIEILGEPREGRLEVTSDTLVHRPDEGEPTVWPLDALTAVQASSRTLQINPRGSPLVSFRFLDDSVFLWENLLHEVLRRFYRRTGRGEIREFQPRIAAGSGELPRPGGGGGGRRVGGGATGPEAVP